MWQSPATCLEHSQNTSTNISRRTHQNLPSPYGSGPQDYTPETVTNIIIFNLGDFRMIENDRINDFRISVVVSNVYRHNLTWQDLIPKVASFHSSFARWEEFDYTTTDVLSFFFSSWKQMLSLPHHCCLLHYCDSCHCQTVDLPGSSNVLSSSLQP